MRTNTARNLFKKLGIYKLEIDDRALFDKPIVDNSMYNKILQNYYNQFQDAIDLLQKNKIPVIVSTVAGNYSEWEPNRSVYGNENNDGIEKFKEFMSQGNSAAADKDYEKAISFYKKGLSLCNEFAELHFILGDLYKSLGNYGEAWNSYIKAVEFERMPIRATRAQNTFIKNMNRLDSVHIVDSVEYLRQNSSQGLIGFNLMVDGHHPNLEGYILISKLISRKINEIFMESSYKLRSLSSLHAKNVSKIGPQKDIEISISRGKWFYRMATWRYSSRNRLILAQNQFFKALDIDNDIYEPYLGLSIVNFLRKDKKVGNYFLSKAKDINNEKVSKYLKQNWIKRVLKRADDAE